MADTAVDELTVPDIVQDPDETNIIDKVSEDGEIDVDGIQYTTVEEISKEPFIVENVITVMMGDPLSLEADAYVNLCMGNIHSGNDYFLQVHNRAGDELKVACHKFRGAQVGTARISPAYELNNYKYLLHTILPLVDDKYVGIAPYQTHAAILQALDLAAENEVKTIVVPPGFSIESNIFAYMLLLTIKKWLTYNPNVFESISIVCDNENDFYAFHQQIPAIDGPIDFEAEDFDKYFSAVQYTSQEYAGQTTYVDADGYELGQGTYYQDENGQQYEINESNELINRKVDIHDQSLLYETDHLEQRTLLRTVQMAPEESRTIYDIYNKTFHVADGGIKLQLSRNLSPTMLAIEEPDGRIRQYRLTTQSRNGDAYYFRCSHCEFLSKKTSTQYRPKMTVRDGTIVGGFYPMHHPECLPLSKKEVLIQQIDRQVRAQIMNQNMMMREMYEKDVAEEQQQQHNPEEVSQENMKPRIKFPSWEQVRKQYYRLKAKGEKLAAAGLRKQTMTFVEAVPILVQPDQRTINADVIQRADRQIESEAYGITNDEEDIHQQHHEEMYPTVYTTYPSTSEPLEQSQITEEEHYYDDNTVNGRNVSRLTEVIVKEEMIEQKDTSRELLGMPSYSSQITKKTRRSNKNKTETSNTNYETVEDIQFKKGQRSRVAIMPKLSRKRQLSQNTEPVSSEPSPKRTNSVSDVSADESSSPIRRSARLSAVKSSSSFLE